jgi:hypothetical protein
MILRKFYFIFNFFSFFKYKYFSIIFFSMDKILDEQINYYLQKPGVLKNANETDLKILNNEEFLLGYILHYFSFFPNYKNKIEQSCNVILCKEKWMFEAHRRFVENIFTAHDFTTEFDLFNFQVAFEWLGILDENQNAFIETIRQNKNVAALHPSWSKTLIVS